MVSGRMWGKTPGRKTGRKTGRTWGRTPGRKTGMMLGMVSGRKTWREPLKSPSRNLSREASPGYESVRRKRSENASEGASGDLELLSGEELDKKIFALEMVKISVTQMGELYHKQLEFVQRYSGNLEQNIEEIRCQKQQHAERENFEKACLRLSSADAEGRRQPPQSPKARKALSSLPGLERFAILCQRRQYFFFAEIIAGRVARELGWAPAKRKAISKLALRFWRSKGQKRTVLEIKAKFSESLRAARESFEDPAPLLEPQDFKKDFETRLKREFAAVLRTNRALHKWIQKIKAKLRK